MKKLNPITKLPFRRGEIIRKGVYFIRYQKNTINTDGFYAMNCGSLESIEKIRKYKSKWQSCNKDKHAKTKAKSLLKLKSKAKDMLNGAKGRAKTKSIDFNLTFDWLIKKLEFGVCELSGINFNFNPSGNNTYNPFSPSIDRIDNLKGYTIDNCRVVITAINLALNSWGLEQYLYIAKKVIKNQEVS